MSRSCDEIRRRLWEGDHDPPQEHLARCDGCRREAEEAARLLGALAVAHEVEPPADLDARVRLALSRQLRRQPRLRITLVGPLLGIVAALAWFTALQLALAETSIGAAAPLVAAVVVVIYLIVCSSAMLPLVVRQAQHLREEARP